MKKKIIKRIIIFAIVLIIAPLVYFSAWELYYGPYPYCREKVELTYLGSATGECPYFKDENGLVDPEKWKEKKFVYCWCQSYVCFKQEDHIKAFSEECNLNYNFDFTFREGHRYVCAYGYPLKTLGYSKYGFTYAGAFYNRARLDKKNYNEGVWYFYEIEDINIGDMSFELDLDGVLNVY